MSKRPYIGLRPFERTETDIFFGRETHTDELIDRLGASHFLAVVGTSGCGKSSLVKTGLIAGLEAGYLAKAGTHWHIVEMRPSNQPFKALADGLLFKKLTLEKKLPQHYSDLLRLHYTTETLQQTLEQGSLSLHELLAQHPLPNNAQLLIVCDQFEEIFRYFQQGSSAEARNFVSLLLASSKPYPVSTTQLSDSVYVVITMRSDFLGDCAQFAGLAEAINQGLYLTPRLNAQQLRAAIEEPSFVFEGEIEPALITQLLEDAQNNQDQLPLLQHVLMCLWDLASNKTATLTLADYKAIGGLSNALSNHADKVYDQLNNEDKQQNKKQRIAELLFRSLTERGDTQRDTRRPTPLAEIIELTASSFDEVVAVIDAFRQTDCCFLMPPINVTLTIDSIIDISHESLIRQWQKLKDWTQDEAERAKDYQELKGKVIEWTDHGENKAYLLQSPKLENYQKWWQEKKPTELWAKRYGGDIQLTENFLKKSKSNKKQTLFNTIIFIFILSIVFGIFAYTNKELDRKNTELINEQDQFIKQEKVFDALNGKIITDKKLSLEYYIKFYEGFIGENSSNDVAKFRLGKIYHLQGKEYAKNGDKNSAIDAYNKAIGYYNEVVTIDTDSKVTFLNLGNAYRDLGSINQNQSEFDKAIEKFNQQIKVNHNIKDTVRIEAKAWALYSRGMIYENQKKNIDTAILDYQEAIKVSNDYKEYVNNKFFNDLNELTWFRLGGIYLLEGNQYNKNSDNAKADNAYEKAIDAYTKVVDFDKDSKKTWGFLGLAYQNKNRFDEAIKNYKKQIEVNIAKVEYNKNLENKDSENKDRIEASKLAWYHLGEIYENPKNLNLDAAILAYDNATKINPDFKDAWLKLNNIYKSLGKSDKELLINKELIRIDENDRLKNLKNKE